MKKFFILSAIITNILIFPNICNASTQKPALWPAIESIEKTDGGYLFNINVMVYCPEGVSGTLIAAAYDEKDKLLDVDISGEIDVSPYEIPGNCSNKNELGKTFDSCVNLNDNEYIKIKSFVFEDDYITPLIENGSIEYFYNSGESYVDVDYVLESEHYNHTNGDYYYYYYYDGKYSSVEVSFDVSFYVGSQNSFPFYYYGQFDLTSGIYKNNELKNTTLSHSGFSGVKFRTPITTTQAIHLGRYGFKTEAIKIIL